MTDLPKYVIKIIYGSVVCRNRNVTVPTLRNKTCTKWFVVQMLQILGKFYCKVGNSYGSSPLKRVSIWWMRYSRTQFISELTKVHSDNYHTSNFLQFPLEINKLPNPARRLRHGICERLIPDLNETNYTGRTFRDSGVRG